MASKATQPPAELRRAGERPMAHRQRMVRTAQAFYVKADSAVAHGDLDRAATCRARAEGFERAGRGRDA